MYCRCDINVLVCIYSIYVHSIRIRCDFVYMSFEYAQTFRSVQGIVMKFIGRLPDPVMDIMRHRYRYKLSPLIPELGYHVVISLS